MSKPASSTALALALCLIASPSAWAVPDRAPAADLREPAAPPRVARVGVTPVALVPLGRFAKTSGIGLGAVAGLELGRPGGWSWTARAGYVHFLEKDNAPGSVPVREQTSAVPIWLGTKRPLILGIYAAGELAVNVLRTTIDLPRVSYRATDVDLGGNLGLGWAWEGFDVSLRASLRGLGDPGRGLAAMASVGYAVPIF